MTEQRFIHLSLMCVIYATKKLKLFFEPRLAVLNSRTELFPTCLYKNLLFKNLSQITLFIEYLCFFFSITCQIPQPFTSFDFSFVIWKITPYIRKRNWRMEYFIDMFWTKWSKQSSSSPWGHILCCLHFEVIFMN